MRETKEATHKKRDDDKKCAPENCNKTKRRKNHLGFFLFAEKKEVAAKNGTWRLTEEVVGVEKERRKRKKRKEEWEKR